MLRCHASVTELRPEILSFYEQGREADRLSDGGHAGPLEFARTIELFERFLPVTPARVLDVGGGPGRYAEWFSARGDEVLLLDPVPLHVEQARQRLLRAELGDARELHQPDESYDVVLLMGPLYHLPESTDRRRSLEEAARVLRPGGLPLATGISRFAALMDLLVRLDRLHEPGVFDRVEEAVRTGVFRPQGSAMFTTAFFHLPTQLRDKVAGAGFARVEMFSIEGPGFLAPEFDQRWADADRRETMVRAARLVESHSELLGAASHLLAVGRRAEAEA